MFFLVICSHAQWVHFELSLEPKLFGKHTATTLCVLQKKIRPTNMHSCVSKLQESTYDRGELPKRSINFGDIRLRTNELEKNRSRVA